MDDISTLLIVTGTFLLAGTLKGIIGMGLPMVALALLTVALDLPMAMALLLMPSLVTNLWQGATGGNFLSLLKRLWPFYVMAASTVWFGAQALTRVDLLWLSALLGLLLLGYGIFSLMGLGFHVASNNESWLGAFLGAINGVLAGMTGVFTVPGVMYLQAIGLPRDLLVQAMGLLFSFSTIALAIALRGSGLLSLEQGMLSTIGVLPAIAGMMFGLQIRKRFSEQTFRKLFFCSLIVLGGYLSISVLASALVSG